MVGERPRPSGSALTLGGAGLSCGTQISGSTVSDATLTRCLAAPVIIHLPPGSVATRGTHARRATPDRQKAALLAAAAARLANVATIFLRPASLIMAIALLGSTHCVVR